MSIVDFITRECVQTAVYWGNPQDTGFGGQTFDDPVEIMCRWEDRAQLLGSITGNQIIGFQDISRATVFVLQDVSIDGFLYLGTLDSLTQQQQSNPKSIEGAHIIKRFEKLPALGSTTAFLRKAYLSPWLS